uniref:Pol polyprotein n=1 Tax=Cajanus cajan TaxID=3821 RepID=A0A151S5V8_CAJCA|nr:Pol polyprotein [Cajanus cajan]
MDILGPFPPAKGQLKFLLVAVDYFTKWIEACPLAKITTENVRKFTWKNIVCRFGIPHTIVTDNGRQFVAGEFEDFLRELGIKHFPTSVEHPQTNGQAEAANKVILRELKK